MTCFVRSRSACARRGARISAGSPGLSNRLRHTERDAPPRHSEQHGEGSKLSEGPRGYGSADP
jgi:hypothetical protein